ncbi:alpha-1A adrenergic receptor-like [Physella acuta]|uniref:alpha-1A adrenergic receptor-like n=1 Tax=Physella acuta TaxID=109671 RepID=UPI0027DB9452|nr:alpha-1A adrenergic receptor-like [Physella acuta]
MNYTLQASIPGSLSLALGYNSNRIQHPHSFTVELDQTLGNVSNITTSLEQRSCLSTILLTMVLAVIVLLTISGNVLVIASVVLNANLRTTTNYFIANLAIADLLLGTTVLPFSATLEVLQYWVFGQIFCDVWAAIDVLCCTASILSLCVISIDRYIGVTRPLQHARIIRHTRAVYIIIFVWLLSMAISVAPLIGWKEESNPDPRVCTVTTQPGYVLFSVAGSFYIPCFIILGVYFRIYRETVKYTKCLMSGAKLAKVDEENVVSLRIHTGRLVSTSSQQDHCHVDVPEEEMSALGYGKLPRQLVDKDSGRKRNSRLTFSNKVAKFKREKKAAKTLGIVVGVFITCWLPFFVILPLDSLCPTCSVPPLLFKLFFWLGYCNSTMNPIIYTLSSNEFRRAFLAILCCRKCRSRPRVSLTELQLRAKSSCRQRRVAHRQHYKQPGKQQDIDTASVMTHTGDISLESSVKSNGSRHQLSQGSSCSNCHNKCHYQIAVTTFRHDMTFRHDVSVVTSTDDVIRQPCGRTDPRAMMVCQDTNYDTGQTLVPSSESSITLSSPTDSPERCLPACSHQIYLTKAPNGLCVDTAQGYLNSDKVTRLSCYSLAETVSCSD